MNKDGLFYLAFALIIGITAFIIIPKLLYKKFLLYGLVFGGIADAIIANVCTITGIIRYNGFGAFGLIDTYSILTPITWTFAFMLFFYFLPVRKGFLIVYILGWSAINYSVGIVMQNLHLFSYLGIGLYIAPIIFIVWYSISAYVFRRYEQKIQLS
jgi:hypothetical protein